ncbi:MAG: retropepsin-like aspartic protease [Bacteroidales bacterium]
MRYKLTVILLLLFNLQNPVAGPGSLPVLYNNAHDIKLSGSETKMILVPEGEIPIMIPLRFSGNLMLLECRIDSISGYLVFDTGTSEIILNQVYFRNYSARTLPQTAGITGSAGEVKTITVGSILVSELEFKKVTTHMADLSHLENNRNVRILGLVNFELFKSFTLIIDARNAQLLLIPQKEKGKKNKGLVDAQSQDMILQVDFSQNILFMQGSIAQKKIRFCLDTGAETNVINSRNPDVVLNTIAITGKTTLRGTGRGKNEVLSGSMKECDIGGRKIQDMRTIIANLDPLNEAYGYHIDGMLGYPFLQKCCLCINFADQTMGIKFYKETYVEMNK